MYNLQTNIQNKYNKIIFLIIQYLLDILFSKYIISEAYYITFRVTVMEDPMTADFIERYICLFVQIYTSVSLNLYRT